MKRECPGITVQVFSDRDISDKRGEMEAALQGADMFFGSLLFDYDQVGDSFRYPTMLWLCESHPKGESSSSSAAGTLLECDRTEAVLHSLCITLAQYTCTL